MSAALVEHLARHAERQRQQGHRLQPQGPHTHLQHGRIVSEARDDGLGSHEEDGRAHDDDHLRGQAGKPEGIPQTLVAPRAVVEACHGLEPLPDAQGDGEGEEDEARHDADELRVHAADLGGALGRELGGAFGELIEAIAPAADEVLVVELLFDDDLEHGHAQSRVRASAQLDVDVGAGGEPVDAWVDHDEARATTHGIDDSMAEEAVGAGLERMLAPDHQDFGELVVLVVPTAGQSASVVPFGIGAARDVGHSGQTRGVARITGLGVAEVGSTEAHGLVGSEGATLVSAAESHADAQVGNAVVVVGIVEFKDAL